MKKIILSLFSVMAISFSLSAAADDSVNAPPVNAPAMNAPAVNPPAMTAPSVNAPAMSPPPVNAPSMSVPSAPMGPMGSGGGGGDHPCKRVAQACQAAGYQRDSTTGKGMMQCMKPLMQGQSVPGVSVSAEDIAACKAKHAARMKPMM